jgi:hypothetical protein
MGGAGISQRLLWGALVLAVFMVANTLYLLLNRFSGMAGP